MSYVEDIAKLQNLTVRDIIRVNKENTPCLYKNCPWTYPELNHGVSLLQSEEALCCYMAAYGEMHAIKCMTVFRAFHLIK